MEILIDKTKKFYKANLHTHSTYSDGKLSVEEIKKAYMEKGYSVVAYTDHDVMVDNSHLSDENFIAITSAEIGVREDFVEVRPQSLIMKNVHINLYATDPHNAIDFYKTVLQELPDIHNNFPPEIQCAGKYEKIHCDFSTDNINKIIKLANDKGFLVCLNHPRWNLQTPYEYLNLENLFAVEVYNHGCTLGGAPDTETVFENMLRAEKNVFPIASDDSHNWTELSSPYSDSFGGWVVINSEKLEYSAIITALKNGEFYASTGPEILSLKKEGNKIFVETSPCSKICVLTKGRRTKSVIAEENSTINSAEIELLPSDSYFRIKVIDKFGKAAYTRAYQVNL